MVTCTRALGRIHARHGTACLMQAWDSWQLYTHQQREKAINRAAAESHCAVFLTHLAFSVWYNQTQVTIAAAGHQDSQQWPVACQHSAMAVERSAWFAWRTFITSVRLPKVGADGDHRKRTLLCNTRYCSVDIYNRQSVKSSKQSDHLSMTICLSMLPLLQVLAKRRALRWYGRALLLRVWRRWTVFVTIRQALKQKLMRVESRYSANVERRAFDAWLQFVSRRHTKQAMTAKGLVSVLRSAFMWWMNATNRATTLKAKVS